MRIVQKKIIILIFVVLICSLPMIGKGDEIKYFNNPPNIHLEYISKNADFVGLSNGQFFTVLDNRHIVSRWSWSDPLSIRIIQEDRYFFGIKGGKNLKGLALFNKATNEEVCVQLFRFSPARHTLDQPSYPYLHLKYVDKNGEFILLSNGEYLRVFPEYRDALFSWSCSDVLFFQKAGLFSSSRLYNKTKGENIPVSKPAP